MSLLVFLDRRLKFEWYDCKGYHDVLIMSIILNDIAISRINSADYRCIINGISKSDGLDLLKNVDLTEKKGIL